MSKALEDAIQRHMDMYFPGRIFIDDDLSDWKLELAELQGYVIGITTNLSNNQQFLPKLPAQMKEMRDKLEAIHPIDPRDQKLKEYCNEYFSVLEQVVEEILKSENIHPSA